MFSYPQISLPAYLDVRDALRKSVPNEVTTSWIRINLPQYASEGSAKTLISALRKLGLIDKDSKPTQVAMLWRTDDGYGDACQQMLAIGFPKEVVDAHGYQGVERDTVEKAIMNSGLGQNTSRAVSKLFTFLANRSLDTIKREPSKSKAKGENPRVKSDTKPKCDPMEPVNKVDNPRHAEVVVPLSQPMILRYFLSHGQVAELTFPADISDRDRKRLLKHLQLDLDEDFGDL